MLTCKTLPGLPHLTDPMKPVIAFPFHDPAGTMFSHLQIILPDLKEHFEHLYLCPPPSTLQQAERMRQLSEDDFFTIFRLEADVRIGERLNYLYTQAVHASHPDQPIHLCFLDRLSFALESSYRNQFLDDVDTLTADDLPLIFHRSSEAWATHPNNYRAIESFVMKIGEILFDKSLDYCWCHIVVQARKLCEVMPLVKRPGVSMVAEMIYYLQEDIRTREVDWLAWEDPFILRRNASEPKHERERSNEETQKRLSYVLPMVEELVKFSRDRGS